MAAPLIALRSAAAASQRRLGLDTPGYFSFSGAEVGALYCRMGCCAFMFSSLAETGTGENMTVCSVSFLLIVQTGLSVSAVRRVECMF